MAHVIDHTAELSAVDQAARIDRRTLLAALLLTGLAGAAYAQGGFHASGRAFLAVLLALAALVALSLKPLSVRGIVDHGRLRAGGLPVAALLCWLLIDSAQHGELRAGLPATALLLGVVVTIGCARQLTGDSARLLLTGLLWLGAVVAMLGWAGVLRHRTPAAIEGQGLFRAASTLSYPNATGAFLAVLGLLGTALLAAPPTGTRLRVEGALVAVVLTGLAATLSRGGAIAFAAGFLVLLAALGIRRTLVAAAYPLLAGCLGTVTLLPSAPVGSHPDYPLALLGILAAAGIGAVVPARRSNWSAGLPYALLLAAAFALLVLRPFPAIGHARLTAASDDRWAALHAVGQVIARQPLTGVGPRLTTLAWHPAGGGVQVFRYAHNEYFQVTAEFGLIGLVLMLGCLVALIRLLHRHWPARGADRSLPAAAAAALTAVLVSISLDFTGHFPVLVLTAAALAGCAAPVRPARQ